MYCIQAACGCHCGKIRDHNEDNFYFNGIILPQNNMGLEEVLSFETDLTSAVCFGVFDGMGGEAYGEEASYIAAETFSQYAKSAFNPSNALTEVCLKANARICGAARKNHVCTMGSTAAILCLAEDTANIANVGDSKVFLFRQNELQQLSIDHTDYALLKLYGNVNRKPRLMQYLGIEPNEMIIEPYITSLKIKPNDQFLICSDGFMDLIKNLEIRHILTNDLYAQKSVKEIFETAFNISGKDDITVINCVIKET